MMVKICGITSREDALAAVAAGASALGFNFYPKSPRCITPEAAAEIVKGLPEGVRTVGVFVDEEPVRVVEIVRQAGLHTAQLHGSEAPEALPRGIRVWKALRVGPDFDRTILDRYQVEAFLLDAPGQTGSGPDLPGGTGRTFDWSAAAGLGKPIVLAGGLDAGNVREAIRAVRPWGVDACSRLECAPGRKDHARMAEFIQAALLETTT